MALLIVGSIGIDTIHTEAGSAEDVLGGSASYASLSASYFSRVNLVGIVGEDFPDAHMRLFRKRKIDLDGLEIVKGGRTFRWTGRYHENFAGRDTVEIHLNVFETFRPSIPASYRKTPFVLLSNIDPELQLSVLDQMEAPRFVAADTMNLWLDIKRSKVQELISRVDLIVMNDEEAEQYTGEKNPVCAGRKILKSGVKWAVIKKGSHGSLLFSGNAVYPLPAYPLDRVCDPTGAGDCFIGGLMGYLAAKGKTGLKEMKKGIAYGTVLASFNVQAFSLDSLTKTGRPAIETRYLNFKKISHF